MEILRIKFPHAPTAGLEIVRTIFTKTLILRKESTARTMPQLPSTLKERTTGKEGTEENKNSLKSATTNSAEEAK
jgi:hypothetical protein